jgi:hypothetical protein
MNTTEPDNYAATTPELLDLVSIADQFPFNRQLDDSIVDVLDPHGPHVIRPLMPPDRGVTVAVFVRCLVRMKQQDSDDPSRRSSTCR